MSKISYGVGVKGVALQGQFMLSLNSDLLDRTSVYVLECDGASDLGRLRGDPFA